MSERPRIWFERPLLPDLVAEVETAVEILGPGTPTDPFHGIETAQGIVAGMLRYDGAVLERTPELAVISRTGIGVDRVDIPEATARGVAVCNAPDAPTTSTAEHAIALLLAVAKGLRWSEERLRAGETGLYASHDGIELHGKTLGLIGFGRIARQVAALAQAFGMTVQALDPYVGADAMGDVDQVTSLDELLATSDVVSIHVPLRADTSGMIGATELEKMKDGAILINTARGGLVDHDALLAALEEGRLFGAGLDVTEPEPLPPGHPLLGRPDVVVTPHTASGTRDGKRRLFRDALHQAVQVLKGAQPENLVNPEVWPRVRERLSRERTT